VTFKPLTAARWSRLYNLLPVLCLYAALSLTLGIASALSSSNAVAEQLSAPAVASESLDKLNTTSCLTQLDATVALASGQPDTEGYLERRFAELERRCPDLPHFAHNQGVLAAQSERWIDAIDHLDRSLQLDARASMTYRHLQAIFEHRAAQAYARALKTPVPASAPVLALQRSTDQNAQIEQSERRNRQLRTISTVEYEMFAWWQSIQNNTDTEDFYVHDFPSQAIGIGTRKITQLGWDELQREIAFTTEDAVVVLSDPARNRALLLLRLIGNRWKIYQETLL